MRLLLLAAVGCGLLGQHSSRAEGPEATEFFEKSVRPLLAEHCYKCHGPAVEEVEGGLRLSSREGVLAGGDSGPAAVEGKPDQSLLIEAVRHDGLKMPPDGKLGSNQIEVLRQWIAMGVPWPAGDATSIRAVGAEEAPSRGLSAAWLERLATGRRHWSFQPVKKPALPATENAWAQSDIDRFIVAALDAKGLAPSPPAERAALIRRVTFDLTGLPPTPEEVDQFLHDESPEAWSKLVDRLLEKGVRCVQVWSGGGQPWDNHDGLETQHRKLCQDWDKPIAAFLKDLKQRGMLASTLVLWGGEFGRTPVAELPALSGRDHNHYGFSMWMAGGGVKGGYVHGATDEFGFAAVENKVHVHDLHATILHLLGFDHEKLTYRYAGRDFRLTDVHGHTVREILA
jgi:hypothetical protein